MIQTESLQEYFREALMDALSRTSTLVSPELQAYAVRMLLDFSHSDQAFSGVERGEKPVYALLLARAIESEPQEALRLYKQVGDSTLYRLGFFKGLSHRMVNNSYFLTMGESAYANASHISRPLGLNAAIIYGELAERFMDMVIVFNDMSLHGERNQEAGAISTERLLSLVEQYRQTGDPSLREILIRQGVDLDKESKKS